MAFGKNKNKKKTVNQMTVEELQNYIKERQAEGDMLNYQTAKDELESRNVKEQRETFAKENPDKVEKFEAKKIPQYIGEAVKDIPAEIKKTGANLKENLSYSVADNPEEYAEEVKQYNERMGITPAENTTTEGITTEETTPEMENVPVDWKNVIINQKNSTRSKGKTEPKKSVADYTKDVLKWGGAVGDTIASAYKQKANTARNLAQYGGQFAPGGSQPYSTEETTSPFQNIRKQAYENVSSKMKAEQEAQNKAVQTAIDNLNKEVYDTAASNSVERQAMVNERLGKLSNKLNIDLQKSVYDLKKSELDKFITELDKDLGGLPPKIKDIASVLMKSNLESTILQANVDMVGSGIRTAGDLLSKLVGAAL